LPEKIRSGEGFILKLHAYDAHDNLIADFGETGKDFKVSVSGSAQVQPSILKAASFTGGVTGITIMDKKAEPVVLSIFEVGGTVPVVTKEIIILPNKLDNFFIQSPQSVTAGNNFDIKIIARDAFDNPITDTEIESKNVKVISSGTTSFRVISAPSVFRKGVSVVTLMTEKTGEAMVEVHDVTTGSKGISPVVKVVPSMLSHFKVFAPKDAAAGEVFDVTILAFDAFDNIVNNYASYGSGVNISSTGQVKPQPSFIGSSEFRNGQAIIKVAYEKAEEISIIATENNKNQQGKSTAIKINPSNPDNFVVLTPDTAVAGQRFKIKIEAYDRFNNLVKNYNLIGNDVYLNVTGTGVLSPKMVTGSEFIDGIASVDVLYDRAESFTISASIAARKEEKKIAPKEQKEEVEVPEKKPEPRPKAVEKQKIEKESIVVEKPEKHGKQAALAKEEKVAAKKIEKKEPVKEKKTRERFFEVRKVSLIEAKNKAMVIVNMKAPDKNLEYKEERESRENWIKLSIKPAVNKTKKLWKFKSAFVKEIRIEEDKAATGVVNVRIETLLKQFTFDVNRVKDSLVISITGP